MTFWEIPDFQLSPPLGEVTVMEGWAEVDIRAEQEAVTPPLIPAQVHIHAPALAALETTEVVPAEQRLAVGAEETDTPLAEPHVPFTIVEVPAILNCALVP